MTILMQREFGAISCDPEAVHEPAGLDVRLHGAMSRGRVFECDGGGDCVSTGFEFCELERQRFDVGRV